MSDRPWYSLFVAQRYMIDISKRVGLENIGLTEEANKSMKFCSISKNNVYYGTTFPVYQ
jgi:hypothetical protein